jgi:hypothetical protein
VTEGRVEVAEQPAGSLDWSRIESLLPGLSRRNAEIEQLGELPPDVMTALRSARVWRPWLPRALRDANTATQHYAVSSAALVPLSSHAPRAAKSRSVSPISKFGISPVQFAGN